MWRFRSLRNHTTLRALGVKRSSVPQCTVLSCYRSFSNQNNNLEIKTCTDRNLVDEFIQATAKNEIDTVRRMLETTPQLVNALDENGCTPLMKAKSVSVVQHLLDKGANINAKDEDGLTALIKASAHGDKYKANILLDEGADVNAQDKNGWTALMYACRTGVIEIVHLLLNNGADVNAKNKNDETALIVACNRRHTQIVELLLMQGADVNAIDKNEATALLYACRYGDTQIVQLLLEKGVDVNIQSKHGLTALINASIEGHVDIVELLLNEGADVNAKTTNGDTALLLASQYGDTKIAQLLLDKGADVNAKNKDGKTALYFAEDDDICLMLREAMKKQQADIATTENAENRPDSPSAMSLLERHLDASQRNEREHIPDDFLCPISYDIMEDPVICSDGHSYERGAIEDWLQHHDTSPKTNMRLPNKNLIPNIALRGAIQEFSSRKRART